MTRITGLATGLDVDAVVEETMNAYQTKIDAVDQQMKLAELQQEMYREVITECRDFYDKYFDIAKSDSILLQKNWISTSFEVSNSSVATVTGGSNAKVDNYSIEVKQLAQPAKHTVSEEDILKLSEFKISINSVDIEVDFSEIKTEGKTSEAIIAEKVKLINEKLAEKKVTGMTVEYSQFSKGVIISTKDTGEKQKFTVSYQDAKGNAVDKDVTGKNAEVVIKNSLGETYTHTGESNSLSLDGVNFKFTNVGSTDVTGKTDVAGIKDKLVNFINDYNDLMTKLNTLINEKRDNDYMPLTDAQKEEMTEKQIELWEKKVKTGQLSRDSDLTRIRNAMKTAMSSLTNSLKSFGITAVSDYSGNKNGTFTIDEEALTKALENNTEDVMKVFISNEENNKGVAQQLKTLFDKETQSSSGSLLKKAGMEGSSTASNNTLSKKIAKYEEKIERMKSIFATKQQALYSKYARLETLMNNLNSQSSYLTSMFSS